MGRIEKIDLGRRTFNILAAALLSFLMPCPAVSAQQPAPGRQLLQELFQTEVVYPQEKGEFQFTLAPRWHWKSNRRITQVPLALEFGLTDSWELDFDWDSFVRRAESSAVSRTGIGDFSVGTKYSFMRIGGSPLHAAVGLEVAFPSGDIHKGLTEGFIEYEPRIMLARDFPRWNYTQVFTEIGAALVQRRKRRMDPADDEPAAHEFFWNAGFFVPVRRWRFTAEANWRTNRWNHAGEDHELYVTPGVVWKWPGTWEVGVGVPLGVRGGADRVRLILHVIYEVPLPSREP